MNDGDARIRQDAMKGPERLDADTCLLRHGVQSSATLIFLMTILLVGQQFYHHSFVFCPTPE